MCPDYEIVLMWEHDWKEEWENLSDVIRKEVTIPTIVEPMNPRECLYGGRTGATKLYHDCQGEEQILYVDYTSLYPWVCKYATMPKGHPDIITSNFDDLSTYFGLVRCTVIPPRGLLHPVLPYRAHGKLMFALCRACLETKQQTPCLHSDGERSLRGSWPTPEVLKALEKGYVISNIEIVWHWPEQESYDPETKSGGLFADYIDTFLKIKQESSGWPSWCVKEEDKAKYIQDYEDNEGICLQREQIQKNPGLRSLSKLCLNSMWGKFAQRSNMRQTELFSEPEGVYKLLHDDSVVVHDIRFINEEVVEVNYEYEEDFVEVNPNTNVVIAAFTTCFARLKLYELLEHVGPSCAYYDTDSCVILTKPGDSKPVLGDYLGQLTDELEPGEFIQTWVSGGCKNYAYKTNLGRTVTKVRGITLNHRNSQRINFDTVCGLVKNLPSQDQSETITVTEPRKITRDVKRKKNRI